MPRLLIVHHSPSPAMHALLDAVVAGASEGAALAGAPDGTALAGAPEGAALAGVEVVVRPALVAAEVEALDADGYVLGTPANIGYMSGALKHFFDRVYYPCLGATTGRPYGLYVHGNDDVAGAVRAVHSVAAGIGWTRAHAGVEVTGGIDRSARDACWDLGATLAALVLGEA